jgi:hypothetical protein
VATSEDIYLNNEQGRETEVFNSVVHILKKPKSRNEMCRIRSSWEGKNTRTKETPKGKVSGHASACDTWRERAEIGVGGMEENSGKGGIETKKKKQRLR